jgi:hypothetical protein
MQQLCSYLREKHIDSYQRRLQGVFLAAALSFSACANKATEAGLQSGQTFAEYWVSSAGELAAANVVLDHAALTPGRTLSSGAARLYFLSMFERLRVTAQERIDRGYEPQERQVRRCLGQVLVAMQSLRESIKAGASSSEISDREKTINYYADCARAALPLTVKKATPTYAALEERMKRSLDLP